MCVRLVHGVVDSVKWGVGNDVGVGVTALHGASDGRSGKRYCEVYNGSWPSSCEMGNDAGGPGGSQNVKERCILLHPRDGGWERPGLLPERRVVSSRLRA
jgi:hypothetical protein